MAVMRLKSVIRDVVATEYPFSLKKKLPDCRLLETRSALKFILFVKKKGAKRMNRRATSVLKIQAVLP